MRKERRDREDVIVWLTYPTIGYEYCACAQQGDVLVCDEGSKSLPGGVCLVDEVGEVKRKG